MHGLIFVTWEKYLSERFGSELLYSYRAKIGEQATAGPLASHVYDDETLLLGVETACQLTNAPAATLLREYGRYFMMNGLTSHLCAYLLTPIHSGRDLLLAMRDAHAQMRLTPDAITPPHFSYEMTASRPNECTLIYTSPRQLCAVLLGAIEGAAQRYGEQVKVREHTCMQQGAAACRFELHFSRLASPPSQLAETPEQQVRRITQHRLATLVLHVLPTMDGLTLEEVQARLPSSIPAQQRRPSVLLHALQLLQHAGLVATTASQPGDTLSSRRYWRAPTLARR